MEKYIRFPLQISRPARTIDWDSYSLLTAILILMYTAHAIYAVTENRFLYADGVDFFVNILQSQEAYSNVWSRSRLFADMLTQFPLLLAIRTGFSDIKLLGYLYGASLYIPYLLAILACLWAAWNDKRYYLFLLLFLFASAMNSEFFMVTESHVAACLFISLSFMMVLRPSWNLKVGSGAILLAFFTLRSYQSMVVFGPILAALAAWRATKTEWRIAQFGWALFALWFFGGTSFAVVDMLHPPGEYAPSTQSFVHHLLALFRYDILPGMWGSFGHLHYGALVSTVALLILSFNVIYSPNGKTMRGIIFLAFAILCSSILALLFFFPTALEVNLHYKARTLNVLFPLIIVASLVATRFGYIFLDRERWRYAAAIIAMLGVFQCSWHLFATKQWAGYLVHFREEVSSRRGFVPFEESVLANKSIGYQVVERFNWGWTTPLMSIIIAPEGHVRAIISNRTTVGPFDPRDPKQLPDLSRYGVNLETYIAHL